jgi:glycosyltransferase involved in cell wall biosynthesis
VIVVSRVDVSVVIPARNVASTLGLQLDALASQDFAGSWEVVVVDNGSTDDTAELVRARRGDRSSFHLVECTEPGANRARNAGVRAAAAPRVLLCDADDVVAGDWVREMSAALDHLDLVGGSLEYTRLNSPFLQRTRPHLGTEELVRAVDGVPYVVTANMGIWRTVFDAIGGFDEAFGTGADDVDFSLLAQARGFRIGFARDAVVHYRFKDEIRSFVRQSYSYALGHAHLYAKHAASGTFPRQSRGLRCRLLIRQIRHLADGVSIGDAAARWKLAARAAWLAGSVRGLVKYHAIVTY